MYSIRTTARSALDELTSDCRSRGLAVRVYYLIRGVGQEPNTLAAIVLARWPNGSDPYNGPRRGKFQILS